MSKYYYRVYGLDIESDVEISEFVAIKESELSDDKITFKYGTMESKFKDMIDNGKIINFDKDEVSFHINDVASFCIKNGNEVIIELAEDSDMNLIKIYLMCSCLGFAMIQRNRVAIHGGVIDINGKGMIFTGDRGAGKSTLTTALRNKGYKFISDDVAPIKIDKVPMLMPGFPYQKLCEDAMDNFKVDKEKCTSFMSDTQIKYMVPAHDEFVDYSVELFGICELTVGNVDEVTIEEYKGGEKMHKIIANIYRGEFLNNIGGMQPKYFKQCLDIAKNIKFYKITRPRNQFTVNEQIELIENEIMNCEEISI